ncbi:uncharacterized mitochondrial protein AtMg00810-like [Gossypium hirsutum]|uniref:Uncharacterized mitochondrial protein AtMg00810-like n=1 Tax=Gossypium hirsutum TaxID=3635 RepID=A0A1U8LB16_GOSHI|nr:uncharacterized mitochondrial protein AtMg00810-like [Gossypium hirsutum]
MIDEIKMIQKNQTWELTEGPANRKTIGVKWVYRAKQNTDGSLNKLKARLVVNGSVNNMKIFAAKILSKFSMENCKPTSTPMTVGMKLSSQGDHEQVSESAYRSLVGCLLYLTATRPDIMFAVSILLRFMHCCNTQHFQAAKRVLKYIKGTLSHGIQFRKTENLKLVSYTDSD